MKGAWAILNSGVRVLGASTGALMTCFNVFFLVAPSLLGLGRWGHPTRCVMFHVRRAVLRTSSGFKAKVCSRRIGSGCTRQASLAFF